MWCQQHVPNDWGWAQTNTDKRPPTSLYTMCAYKHFTLRSLVECLNKVGVAFDLLWNMKIHADPEPLTTDCWDPHSGAYTLLHRDFGKGTTVLQSRHVGVGWWGLGGLGGGCMWHQAGADTIPVAPLATPAPSVICVNICKPKVPLSPNVRAVCLAFPLRKPGVIRHEQNLLDWMVEWWISWAAPAH